MFRKILIVSAVFLGVSGLVFAQGHKYIGVKKCAMCHKSEKKGNQYGQWFSTKHAKAYETLGTEEAKKTAEGAGVTGNPQEAGECLKCHITAYGVDAGLLGSKFNKEDGVQCESCHGAGSDYKKMSTMKDREKSIAAGLVIPNEKVCVKCHNSDSPNFEGFSYDEYYEKITHPKP